MVFVFIALENYFPIALHVLNNITNFPGLKLATLLKLDFPAWDLFKNHASL